MNFNIASLKVTLNRNELSVSRKSKNKLSSQDVDTINEDMVERILAHGEDHYKEKSTDIMLNHKDNNSQVEALNRIEKDGIFVIPNYLDAATVDSLCKTIEEISAIYVSKLDDESSFENERAIVQRGLIIKKNYQELANSSKTVFNIRDGVDDGMIDIFNVDKIITDEIGAGVLNRIKGDSFLNQFLKSMPQPLTINNINSYVNTSVTKTRGFHFDSDNKQIKIFIYLTDVLDFGNGPYTFVKGTHQDSAYRSINNSLPKDSIPVNETPIVPFVNIYPVLAKKGSLIVSDQKGFHRGFPQSSNGVRRIITINCR